MSEASLKQYQLLELLVSTHAGMNPDTWLKLLQEEERTAFQTLCPSSMMNMFRSKQRYFETTAAEGLSYRQRLLQQAQWMLMLLRRLYRRGETMPVKNSQNKTNKTTYLRIRKLDVDDGLVLISKSNLLLRFKFNCGGWFSCEGSWIIGESVWSEVLLQDFVAPFVFDSYRQSAENKELMKNETKSKIVIKKVGDGSAWGSVRKGQVAVYFPDTNEEWCYSGNMKLEPLYSIHNMLPTEHRDKLPRFYVLEILQHVWTLKNKLLFLCAVTQKPKTLHVQEFKHWLLQQNSLAEKHQHREDCVLWTECGSQPLFDRHQLLKLLWQFAGWDLVSYYLL
jgi:hypothetical protein